MEFLRFGSSIPGSYWGCCAMDIIQAFDCDPDSAASIQLVSGDGGNPITFPDGSNEAKFAGKTWKDIFLQRLRYGTFGSGDMPNHAFLVVLTDYQVQSEPGISWLKILKEQGFEFIRTVDNSVYSGQGLVNKKTLKRTRSSRRNHLFGLFRNVGAGRIEDPFTPPAAWTELDKVVPEAWEQLQDTSSLADEQVKAQLPLYTALPSGVFYRQSELEADSVPVTLAGKRSQYPQQSAKQRAFTEETNKKLKEKAPSPAPFSTGAIAPAPEPATF